MRMRMRMYGKSVLRSLSDDFMGAWEKSPNEEWRVHLPSSIDIRPMGESGTNAYAQMGRMLAPRDKLLHAHDFTRLRNLGIMRSLIKQSWPLQHIRAITSPQTQPQPQPSPSIFPPTPPPPIHPSTHVNNPPPSAAPSTARAGSPCPARPFGPCASGCSRGTRRLFRARRRC